MNPRDAYLQFIPMGIILLILMGIAAGVTISDWRRGTRGQRR